VGGAMGGKTGTGVAGFCAATGAVTDGAGLFEWNKSQAIRARIPVTNNAAGRFFFMNE